MNWKSNYRKDLRKGSQFLLIYGLLFAFFQANAQSEAEGSALLRDKGPSAAAVITPAPDLPRPAAPWPWDAKRADSLGVGLPEETMMTALDPGILALDVYGLADFLIARNVLEKVAPLNPLPALEPAVGPAGQAPPAGREATGDALAEEPAGEEVGDAEIAPLARNWISREVLVSAEPAGEELTNVSVEVFILDDEGQMQRAYTGNAAGGRFSIPLLSGGSHVIILRKAGYESKAFLVEGEAAGQNIFHLQKKGGQKAEAAHPEAPAPPAEPAVSPLVLPADIVSDADLAPDDRMAAVEAPAVSLGTFALKEATSLREGPSHLTAIQLRFQPGDRVEVLEKTEPLWWKVRFREQTGYVKSLLLEAAGN